jgi:hypothetical protein
MRVKALKTLGGAVVAQAGEEFEITNEAQLRDLLNQGVVVPVESNPIETAKAQHINAEQLAEAREQYIQQTNLDTKAYSEAVQHANNQQADQVEQKRQQKAQQAQQKAEQQAQHVFQQEQAIRQAEAEVEQMRQQVKQNSTLNQATARQQSAQRNQPTQSQDKRN